jgi:hypothetical protein
MTSFRPVLFFSRLWPLSSAVVSVSHEYSLPLIISEIQTDEEMPKSVYGELPILQVSSSYKTDEVATTTIEEYRSILLRLHELFPSYKIIPDDLHERNELINFVTECEQKWLLPLTGVVMLDPFYSLSLGLIPEQAKKSELRRYASLFSSRNEALHECKKSVSEFTSYLKQYISLHRTSRAFARGLLSYPERVPSLLSGSSLLRASSM